MLRYLIQQPELRLSSICIEWHPKLVFSLLALTSLFLFLQGAYAATEPRTQSRNSHVVYLDQTPDAAKSARRQAL